MDSLSTAGDESTSQDSAVRMWTSAIEQSGRQSDGLQGTKAQDASAEIYMTKRRKDVNPSVRSSLFLQDRHCFALRVPDDAQIDLPSRQPEKPAAPPQAPVVGSQKSVAPEFVYLESKNYREVEALGSSGDASGWNQVRVSTAASDTDACQPEMICIKKENSSGCLPPVVSMMQATEARE